VCTTHIPALVARQKNPTRHADVKQTIERVQR
jgi:hypothetical protein